VQELNLNLQNEDVELDFQFGPEGVCRIKDRKTGEAYESPDLGVVKAWDQTEDRFRRVLLVLSPNPEDWQDPCNVIEIERESDTSAVIHVRLGGEGSASAMGGIRLGIQFDIAVELSGSHLDLTIPEESFKEHRPERFRVFSIELLPMLGATPKGSRGYLFMPTRSGAVYYFDREHPRAHREYGRPGQIAADYAEGLQLHWGYRSDSSAEYGSLVYGEQGKWEDLITMPLYATVRDGSALAGIILGGEYDTEIVARRDYGPDRRAGVSPRFCYRYFWISKRDTVDRTLRLAFLRGEEASYPGIANLYRNYLIDEAGVPTLRQRAERNPSIDYFKDSFYYRIMFGMTFDNVPKCYQSFHDVADTIPYFRDAGFEKVSFIGTGANLGGHDWAHPTVFPFEPAYGGEKGMERLLQSVNNYCYTFGLHVNYKDVYRHSADWKDEAVQRNEWGEFRFHGAWMGGYSYQGIPHKMLEYYARRDLPKLAGMGMHGFVYFDAIGGVMEESFPPGEPVCRREYGEGMNAYMLEGERDFGCVGNEVSIAASLGVLTHTNIFYSGGPIRNDANGYRRNGILDHFVPVQNMVYHGVCLYSGGAEVGGITGGGSNAKTTPEQVKKDYERHVQSRDWGGDLHYEFFTGHEEVAPGVTRSEFSDGTVIFANRNDEDWTGGEDVVPGKGYVVKRPGEEPKSGVTARR